MLAPESIDEYLDAIAPEKRAELERLRGIVHEEVAAATETIAYAMPAFRLDGHYLLGFAATKAGCAFYPGGMPAHVRATDLAGYRTTKGSVTYDPAAPLPETLVRKLIRERVERVRGDR